MMHFQKRRSRERIRHIIVGILSAAAAAGLLLYAWGSYGGTSAGTDATSSATVILEQPSGAYVVFLNRDVHTDAEKLDTWIQFFSGEEIGFLFEDISCGVLSVDASGLSLAKSFQSRLPENQMKLYTEDASLLLSKAYYGNFDVLLLSREAYTAYGAEVLADLDFVKTIESEGKKE